MGSNDQSTKITKYSQKQDFPLSQFLTNTNPNPNIKILLENLFSNPGYSSKRNNMMYNNIIFNDPSKIFSMDKNVSLQNDLFNSKNKDDNYYKFINEMKAPNNMIKNNNSTILKKKKNNQTMPPISNFNKIKDQNEFYQGNKIIFFN